MCVAFLTPPSSHCPGPVCDTVCPFTTTSDQNQHKISNLLRGAREDPKIPPPPILTVVFPFGYHGGLSSIINNISGSIWAHNIINNLFDGSDSILYCPGIRPPPSISPCPVIGRKIRLRRFYLLE